VALDQHRIGVETNSAQARCQFLQRLPGVVPLEDDGLESAQLQISCRLEEGAPAPSISIIGHAYAPCGHVDCALGLKPKNLALDGFPAVKAPWNDAVRISVIAGRGCRSPH